MNGKHWEKYFKKLYEDHPSTGAQPETNLDHDYCFNPLNRLYTLKDLNTTIDKAKYNKAAGHDKLLMEFLKASPERTRKLILRLINTVYKTSIVPKDWCLGIISPIHKEGTKDDPDNIMI